MMTGLRSVLCLVALAILAESASAADGPAVRAQGFPTRPVKLLVGFTPGGGVDINARLLAARLSELLGKQVIVDNRPGAGTNIANEIAAKSAPDGYTLLFNSPAVAINMSLYRNPPYDALRDFAGVSVFSESTNVLVVPASLPAKSLQELLALARAQPGVLNYSSAGAGTTQHLAGELFKLRTGTNIVHVPYKGSAPSIIALISGDVQLSFVNPAAIGQHVKTGRLRALAVAGAKRSELMPDVPTMKEAGVDGVEVPLWYGLLAPAATPREIVHTLAAAVAKAANSPDTRQRLLDQGAEPVGNTPEEFDRQLREEVARWAEVVKVSGARSD
jgi:tripartite-type tricarboxylate transporter receptor subunit TctC